jgi:phosphoribosylformylglycinamidine synthase
VRVGKIIEIELEDGQAKDVDKRLAKMADEMLANPVIEDYDIVL